MKHDRFLIAILVAIVLLVFIAVGLFFVRQGDQNYGSEDTLQGIVRNYILALQKRDYERAYGYLQEATGKPDFNRFREAFISHQLDISNVAAQFGETNRGGPDASVDLIIVHMGSEPFRNTFRETTSALLTQNEVGEWKIARLPYPYWSWDWYQLPGIPSPKQP